MSPGIDEYIHSRVVYAQQVKEGSEPPVDIRSAVRRNKYILFQNYYFHNAIISCLMITKLQVLCK